jgi:hypothetical protein
MHLTLFKAACIRREFSIFSSERSSPFFSWLRAFCEEQKQERIGMFFIGNFALGLIAEDWMKAPVLSQSSLRTAIRRATKEKVRSAFHVERKIREKSK